MCLVGAGHVDKARAAFAEGLKLAPELFKSRVDGLAVSAVAADRQRTHTFFRVAAGLEDPSAAEVLR